MTQEVAKKSQPGHHPTTLSGYIFAIETYVDNRKKMLSSNISSARPHNMVNFGPLAAEIVSLVWGTPANFNGFRVLACVTARHSSSWRQPNFAALNRGRHLYSAGRHHVGHWPTFLVFYPPPPITLQVETSRPIAISCCMTGVAKVLTPPPPAAYRALQTRRLNVTGI